MRRHGLVIGCALAVVACGDGGGFPDAFKPAPIESGTFSLRWQLQDGSGQSETCARAGATSVQVGITKQTTRAEFSATFACELGAGNSGELFTGTYDLTFELLGAAGVILSAPPGQVVVTAQMPATVPTISFVLP
jgi:hypothetical protein